MTPRLPLAALVCNQPSRAAPHSGLGESPSSYLIGQLMTKNLRIALRFDREAPQLRTQRSGRSGCERDSCVNACAVDASPSTQRHGQLQRDLLWTVTPLTHRSCRLLREVILRTTPCTNLPPSCLTYLKNTSSTHVRARRAPPSCRDVTPADVTISR